jgi:hypothetical protein
MDPAWRCFASSCFSSFCFFGVLGATEHQGRHGIAPQSKKAAAKGEERRKEATTSIFASKPQRLMR